jgi:hypothetical protein
MVEAALLHAHHMFDELCERAQPHVSLFCTVLCPGFDPRILALPMRRNALPCFAPASCVLASCSCSKDVVRVGRPCHEQGGPCVPHVQPRAAPLMSSRHRKPHRAASLPCRSTVVLAHCAAAPSQCPLRRRTAPLGRSAMICTRS